MATGMKFAHTAHIASKMKPKSKAPHTWGMLIAGLACGFVGMYFTITRPMTERMQTLETDIAMMQTEMHQLVGTRDDLWKTNDLLTGLRQQQRQLTEANQALALIRQFRADVVALKEDHELVTNSLGQMASLQRELMNNHTDLLKCREALRQIAALHQDVVTAGTSAENQKMQIEKASSTLAQVAALTEKAIQQETSISEARGTLDSLDGLTAALMTRGDAVAESTAIVQGMDELQAQLKVQAEQLPASKETVERMNALELRLAEHDPAITERAEQNLTALTNLGQELSSGTTRIASAIETIELLHDFQTQVTTHADALANMRRDLMEITFLESTVNQTLQILKPLIQLTDMRRMSDAEVREAARVIIDRRMADSRLRKDGPESPRLADRETEPAPATQSSEERVPTPTDLD